MTADCPIRGRVGHAALGPRKNASPDKSPGAAPYQRTEVLGARQPPHPCCAAAFLPRRDRVVTCWRSQRRAMVVVAGAPGSLATSRRDSSAEHFPVDDVVADRLAVEHAQDVLDG